MTVAREAPLPPFDISVILAEAKDNPDPEPAFRAIERACVGVSAEVVVVRARGGPALPRSQSVAVREIIAEDHMLVPERWGLGVQTAQAPVFACLTTELTVHPEWCRALLEALSSGPLGASGTIELAPRAGMVAAAVYLVRFNAFLPKPGNGFRVAENIPGDSAAYRRDAVLAFPELLSEGFWEAEFHRRFKAQGSRLVMTSKSLSTFHTSLGLRSALILRARHGYGFGVTRVLRYRDSYVRLVVAAPIVPFVLLARVFRRAARSRGALWLAFRAFPALALICGAWAWGEGTGAWAARRRP